MCRTYVPYKVAFYQYFNLVFRCPGPVVSNVALQYLVPSFKLVLVNYMLFPGAEAVSGLVPSRSIVHSVNSF